VPCTITKTAIIDLQAKNVADAAGFEPGNGGTKIRSLE
jgi:hypothetical protein